MEEEEEKEKERERKQGLSAPAAQAPRPAGTSLTKEKSNKITETGQEHLPNRLPEQEQEEEHSAARSPTCNLSPHESRARPQAPGSAPAKEGETAKKMG